MSISLNYFVHGTTLDNEKKIAAGWNDVALSTLGIEHTKEASVETRKLHFDAIICSDLYRAVQTANILFDLDKLPIIYDKRLRECNYGTLNGAKVNVVIYSDHIDSAFESGESLIDVETRITSFIYDINKKYMNKKIAIVGHRAPQLAFEVCLNNKSWEEAIKTDWRVVGKWQLGWEYTITSNVHNNLDMN